MTIYTLRKPKITTDSEESHVFEAKPGAGKGCICLPKSLCQKVTTAETTALEQYMCLDETAMQLRIADFGRLVCDTCLTALYAGGGKRS